MHRIYRARPWLVGWMYLAALGHLGVGFSLSWFPGTPILEAYHQYLELIFWDAKAPPEARIQQQWWLSLFGASLQALALYMLALTHIGNRYRNKACWAWLIAGLLIWAPQDIAWSLRANVWAHLWIDLLALGLMLPVLFLLYRCDRQEKENAHV